MKGAPRPWLSAGQSPPCTQTASQHHLEPLTPARGQREAAGLRRGGVRPLLCSQLGEETRAGSACSLHGGKQSHAREKLHGGRCPANSSVLGRKSRKQSFQVTGKPTCRPRSPVAATGRSPGILRPFQHQCCFGEPRGDSVWNCLLHKATPTGLPAPLPSGVYPASCLQSSQGCSLHPRASAHPQCLSKLVTNSDLHQQSPRGLRTMAANLQAQKLLLTHFPEISNRMPFSVQFSRSQSTQRRCL